MTSGYYYLRSSDFLTTVDYQEHSNEGANSTLDLFCPAPLFWMGGPAFWLCKEAQAQAMSPERKVIIWGEIGDKGGYALGALRMGYKHLIMSSSSPLLIKLQECAAFYGATVRLWAED